MTDTSIGSKNRIFSGIQPTGNLHLGNYLGAIRNWVALQHEFESLYCIVDLHAITIAHDPSALQQATREVVAGLLAAGIDPKKSIIFNQSRVPEHTELAWVLGCFTSIGRLNRMTQFKEKAGKDKERASLGLYSYPVLMAADILLYKATHVPVGEDQKQHLELTRDIATAINGFAKRDILPLPMPQILGKATRVMSLRDGTAKMSKSDESDYARIGMQDEADTIARKIKKAKTDADPLPDHAAGLEGRPEAKNLVTIYAALAECEIAEVLAEFAGKGFGDFKPALIDLAIAHLTPVAKAMQEYLADTKKVDAILDEGASRAQALAAPVMAEIREVMGFVS
ncbi:MAG: tryptophan--tRNA ligase [Proteobacteria bacterium]|nr:tryptophan--tRNA ligase [Pseudomonadota bacterium]